jgi:hypothetical protein
MASNITSNWLTTPTGASDAGQGDDAIVDVKSTFHARIGREHREIVTDASPQGDHGVHLAGSAVIYVQASAPTLRPDGVTPLSALDHGRLWIDTDGDVLYYWKWDVDSGAWTPVTAGASVKVAYVDSSAPTTPAPAEGMLWYDTTDNVLKVYTSDAWVVVSGKIPRSLPAAPVDGDIWIV